MNDEYFTLDSIIEEMTTILGIPKLDLSIQNIGKTGPLKSYYISKCCCFHESEKIDGEEVEL
jgi:hypothetical protein